MKYLHILTLCSVLGFSNIFAQETLDTTLSQRVFGDVSFDTMQEIVSTLELRTKDNGKSESEAVLRLCSDESFDLAIIKSSLRFPQIIDTFNGVGYFDRKLIILKSEECMVNKSSIVSSEIYEIHYLSKLPSYVEKYFSNDINVKVIDESTIRFIGNPSYLKSAKKLIYELQQNTDSKGVILFFYRKNRNEVESMLRRIQILFKKKKIKEYRYKVSLMKWTNNASIYSTGNEFFYPSFFSIKLGH